VNSFFFLMDVSWLSQVEGAARSQNEDFLSSLFAESISQSPSMASLASPHQGNTLEENSGLGYSTDLLCSMDQMPASQEPEQRPHRSHFAKKDGSTDAVGLHGTPESSAPTSPSASNANLLPANRNSTPNSPRGGGAAAAAAQQRTQFLTKNGETIAHFIHERYFGRKSLAQADLKHAALLGCSQVPDYITLRDKGSINYTPSMYNSLVAAVTKKFSSDVIPQFLNSTTFQMMTFALVLTGYFEKGDKTNANNARKILLLMQQPEQEKVKEASAGVGFNNPLIRGVWSACRNIRKNDELGADDSSSDNDDDGDDDDDDDDDDNEKSENDDDEQ